MEENSSFTICNHIQCEDQNNIGFVQDILTIGITHTISCNRIVDVIILICLLTDRIGNAYKKYTRIVTDYLCRFIDLADEYYFFMIESKYPKIENEYGGCSLFKKDKTDYCVGTAETKILLNEKITCIGTENEVITELYRNPNYKADEE